MSVDSLCVLLDAICAVLSKSSFPVNRPLSNSHMLAMHGLFSILGSLRAGCATLKPCTQSFLMLCWRSQLVWASSDLRCAQQE